MTTAAARRVQAQYGKEQLILETGRLAKQADGAVLAQYGGTAVLVSVVISKEPKEGIDFLPLTVEYQERTYAAGKIPGGFFKREGRPSEKEILTSRLIDRPIRPLFAKGFVNEVQVIAFVLSHDKVNDPDVVAINAASAALAVAGAPVARIAACRVGRVDGQFILNPAYEEMEKGDLDLVVVATKDGIIMVESGAKEIPEDVMVEALKFGQEHCQQSIALQQELAAQVGKPERQVPLRKTDDELLKKVQQIAGPRLEEGIRARSEKEGGDDGKKALIQEILGQVNPNPDKPVFTAVHVAEAIGTLEKKIIRGNIAERGQRVDGRDLTTVRPISCEVGILQRTHGTGLFQRGQTQSLCAVTLGTGSDEQMIDSLTGKWNKSFMLHYNFPPFSVGETRPMRGPGRREIGHGALAERALRAVVPTKEQFPYTIRLVSEILESNGSSSMATVCGGTLALLDAGVPLKAPVAGIAMGLIKENNQYTVLTDIIGLEDHYGDMDFKVAGTAQGITALQLDLKVAGVPVEILAKAIAQSKPAREMILQKIAETIASPRAELSQYAPRIAVIKIDPEKIGALIGPGGKVIRRITQETGATIDVEDDGTVRIACSDPVGAKKAFDFVTGLTEEVQVGKVYQGTVKRLMNFGAFCEILPGKEGLCHVSELSDQFVPRVEDVVKVGDPIEVKVVEVDTMGRINLSHRQTLASYVPSAEGERSGGQGGGDRGPRSGGDRGPRGGGDRGPRSGGGDRGGRGGFGGRDRGPRSGGDRGPRGGGARQPGSESSRAPRTHEHAAEAAPSLPPEAIEEDFSHPEA